MTGRRLGRRDFLAASGVAGLSGLAGCFGVLETQRANREPPLPENRPDAAYVPSHVEGMQMVGMQTQGRYACALSYTFPHRFWLVRGTDTDRVDVEGADDVHMMASVWDREAGVVLPGASPQIEYSGPEGETTSFAPWQMLSQRMGVHFGDNVTLGAEGAWDVTVRAVPPKTRRSASGDVSTDPVEFSFELGYDRATLDGLSFEDIPSDREGTEGAVEPMDMHGVAPSQAPPVEGFPVEVRGTERTGGAELVVATPRRLGDLAAEADQAYLAVSLRTPHNRFVLPNASVSATVESGGDRPLDGDLTPTIDPDLGYHYGGVVDTGEPLERVTVSVDTAPQVSRHEGYETAFFDFDDVSV